MNFELNVVKKNNQYFKCHELNGIAYRLKQSRFTKQRCDLLIDSRKYYIAIECKTTKKGLFFSSNFSKDQVKNMTEFVTQTERRGYLVVKYGKIISFIPWKIVDELYTSNIKAVSIYVLLKYQINFEQPKWLDRVLQF